MKRGIVWMRDRVACWFLRIDPEYLPLYRAMTQVMHLPPLVLAGLAHKPAEGPMAGAGRTGHLRAAEPSVATDAPTSRDAWLGQVASSVLGQFADEDRRGSVWVRNSLFESSPGYHTGLIDPADVKRIITKAIDVFESTL